MKYVHDMIFSFLAFAVFASISLLVILGEIKPFQYIQCQLRSLGYFISKGIVIEGHDYILVDDEEHPNCKVLICSSCGYKSIGEENNE